jgi:hypothetical protein
VATGRSYSGIRYLFGEMSEGLYFIIENGSIVLQHGRMVSCNTIAPELAREAVTCMRRWPDSHLLLSAPDRLYTDSADPAFLSLLRDGYHFDVEQVEDLMDYCDNAVKLSIRHIGEIEEIGSQIEQTFQGRLHTTVGGEAWVDCVHLASDKGNALAVIQQELGIAVEETMAFGDNCNDIGMIRHAGESYAMANAHPRLKAAARFEAPACSEDGVLRTIRSRLL